MTDENRTTEKQISQPAETNVKTSEVNQPSRNDRHKKVESDANFWARIKAKWPNRSLKEKPDKQEVPVSELKWVRIRMFPIWLRLLIVFVLMIVAAVLGALLGFSVLGDGSAGDVFRKETWQHIFDIMNGKGK
ncbi:DNA-directed RNA polymerase subunit beta [Sporosarcina sp.]|uniref:DNA-directed RNA polymerase subunit beta n=1 Tax=Sporosarcina sp. TaxID=49982 RepID=UPI0026168A9F|nr:DNA-directed RNA polymerase subunit beta [Sporosarcina sp.]